VRAFSTDGKPKEDYSSIEEDEERDGANTASPDSPMEKYANQIKVGAGLAAGSVVFYGISRLFYDVAYQFLALTPAVSLKYGFYGGSLTAFGVTAMGYGVARGLQPNPEGAFRQGLALANANEDLRSLLGGYLIYSAQDLKMYKARGGSFGVVNGSVQFKHPKVELVFTGSGPMGKANVLVIYHQNLFQSPTIDFCGADVVSTAGSRGLSRRTKVVVSGSPDGNDNKEFSIMDNLVKSSKLAYRDATDSSVN
jgi:hypothetical protein